MNVKPILAIHGGAGTVNRNRVTPEKIREYEQALQDILLAGQKELAAGASALDVVENAVHRLEDCPLFNAGKGAVYTSEGTHELDATIMDGATLKAGAVAQLHHVRNPIRAARAVLKSGQYVFLAGHSADEFAREAGLEMVEQDYYSTPERLEQLKEVQRAGGMRLVLDHDAQSMVEDAPISNKNKFGTVGAVACDLQGNLAAATSTGGMTNKRPGRVGDSAIIGAGCYADNDTAAISTTGTGETFIRAVVAYDICALMKYRGMSLEEATNFVIEKQTSLGGQGGLVAVDRHGNVCMPFNTAGMYRGSVCLDGQPCVAIYK